MRERKKILVERGDGFLVLPGGIGTYEEFFQTLVGRQLGEHNKPIGIVNSFDFYRPLLSLFTHGEETNFIRQDARDLFIVDEDVNTVINGLANMPSDAGPKMAPQEPWPR